MSGPNTSLVAHDPGTGRSRLGGALVRRAAAMVDVTLLHMMMTRDRLPHLSDYERLRAEVAGMLAHLEKGGHLDGPATFHPAPSAPATLRVRRGWMPGLRYEQVSFDSGFEADAPADVAARWWGRRENRTARAAMLQHDCDEPRPWLICLHGLGTGSPWLDLPAFRAPQLHKQLGLNLLLPMLPLHDARRARGMHRAAMMSFELVDTVLALAQAVWDTRRLIAWLRAQGAQQIGLYGLSIGAYVGSLVAALEPVDLLMGGIPVSDIPSLFAWHTPPAVLVESNGLQPPERDVQRLFEVVSPLHLTPKRPRLGTHLFAGVADRVTPPAQAQRLWEAWGRPPMHWFEGGHASFFWSKSCDRFVDSVLTDAGWAVEGGP